MKKTVFLISIFIFLLPLRALTQDFWIDSPEYSSCNERTRYYKIYYYHDNVSSGSDYLFFSPSGNFGILDRFSGLDFHSTGSYERNGIFFSANATPFFDELDILIFYKGFFIEPFIFGSHLTYLWGKEQPSRYFFGMRTLIPDRDL